MIDASRKGLPALERFIGPEGLQPALDTLDPFLANLNPILRYLAAYRKTAADFLTGPGAALSGVLEPQPDQPAVRHYLKQLSYLSSEVLSVYENRIPENRGNAYPPPEYLTLPINGPRAIFPNFDCKNLDYTETSQDTDEDVKYRFTNPDGSDGGVVTESGGPDTGPAPGEHFAGCFFTRGLPRDLRRRARAGALLGPVGLVSGT